MMHLQFYSYMAHIYILIISITKFSRHYFIRLVIINFLLKVFDIETKRFNLLKLH